MQLKLTICCCSLPVGLLHDNDSWHVVEWCLAADVLKHHTLLCMLPHTACSWQCPGDCHLHAEQAADCRPSPRTLRAASAVRATSWALWITTRSNTQPSDGTSTSRCLSLCAWLKTRWLSCVSSWTMSRSAAGQTCIPYGCLPACCWMLSCSVGQLSSFPLWSHLHGPVLSPSVHATAEHMPVS